MAASNTISNMGIGPLGNATFKRKYRWTFRVENIGGNAELGVGGQYVKVANRPQLITFFFGLTEFTTLLVAIMNLFKPPKEMSQKMALEKVMLVMVF